MRDEASLLLLQNSQREFGKQEQPGADGQSPAPLAGLCGNPLTPIGARRQQWEALSLVTRIGFKTNWWKTWKGSGEPRMGALGMEGLNQHGKLH